MLNELVTRGRMGKLNRAKWQTTDRPKATEQDRHKELVRGIK